MLVLVRCPFEPFVIFTLVFVEFGLIVNNLFIIDDCLVGASFATDDDAFDGRAVGAVNGVVVVVSILVAAVVSADVVVVVVSGGDFDTSNCVSFLGLYVSDIGTFDVKFVSLWHTFGKINIKQ